MTARFRLIRFITDMRLRDTLAVGALVFTSSKAQLLRGPLPKHLPRALRYTIDSILDRLETTPFVDDATSRYSLNLLIEPPREIPDSVIPTAWVDRFLSAIPSDPAFDDDDPEEARVTERRRRVSIGRDWLHRHDVDQFVGTQFHVATAATRRPSVLLDPFSQFVLGREQTMILEPFAPVVHHSVWKRQVTEVAKSFALLSAMIRTRDVDLDAELVAYFLGASSKHIDAAQELFAEVHSPAVRVVDASTTSGLSLIDDIRQMATIPIGAPN